jgi:P4 family phage/plasmid primase-like protien
MIAEKTALPSNGTMKRRSAQESKAKVLPMRPGSVSFPQDEIALHVWFLQEYGQDIKWCTEEKCFYHWDGRRWLADRDEYGVVYGLAKKFIMSLLVKVASIEDDMQRQVAAKKAASFQREQIITVLTKLVRPDVRTSLNDFDKNPWLLNVQNGTIDLHTGQLRSACREDMITKLAPVVYDPTATATEWQDFIHWTCLGSTGFVDYKQRLFGSFLTGSVKDQIITIDFGEGGNGKTTQYGMIQRVLGDDYVVSMSAASLMTSTKRDGAGPSPDIAELKGARLVIASEGEAGQHLAESLTKILTGGDVIKARPMYGRPIQFAPTHKIVMFTNHEPVISGMDKGIWRRIRKQPSLADIDADEAAGRRQKREMFEILDSELSGILNWLIAGCLLWQQQGLGICDEVQQATSEYRVEMDRIGNFLAEWFPTLENYTTITVAESYVKYRAWCDDQGIQSKLTKPRFLQAMKSKGLTTREGHARVAYWSGIVDYLAKQQAPVEPPKVSVPEQTVISTQTLTNEGIEDPGAWSDRYSWPSESTDTESPRTQNIDPQADEVQSLLSMLTDELQKNPTAVAATRHYVASGMPDTVLMMLPRHIKSARQMRGKSLGGRQLYQFFKVMLADESDEGFSWVWSTLLQLKQINSEARHE